MAMANPSCHPLIRTEGLHSHDHGSLPCGNCRKRHVRPSRNAGSTDGRSSDSGAGALRLKSSMKSFAALVLALSSVTFLSAPAAVATADAQLESVGVKNPASIPLLPGELWGGDENTEVKSFDRVLQEEEHDHDHDHDAHVDEPEGEDDHDHDAHVEDPEEEHNHDHDAHGEDNHGNAAETSEFAETYEESSEAKPWGPVIGATLIVNAAALSGVMIVIIPAIHRGYLKLKGEDPGVDYGHHGKFLDVCVPGFAVGALMATALFLVFPEALHLIEGAHGGDHSDHSEHADHSDHEDATATAEDDHSGHNHRILQEEHTDSHDDSSESLNAAKFGMAVLGGFLLPVLLSLFVPHHHETSDENNINAKKPVSNVAIGTNVGETTADNHTQSGEDDGCESCNAKDVETGVSVKRIDAKDSGGNGQAAMPQDRPDDSAEFDQDAQEALPTKTEYDYRLGASVLIGDAFHNFADGMFVGAAFMSCSWATAMSITLITLFHEIAQELADFVILTRYVGLSVVKAFAFNFISGLSVTLGAIVVFAGDPTDEAIGIILAMAGGVYINVAASETMPRLDKFLKTRADRALTLFSIIVGTVPIGLVLLNHQHC